MPTLNPSPRLDNLSILTMSHYCVILSDSEESLRPLLKSEVCQAQRDFCQNHLFEAVQFTQQPLGQATIRGILHFAALRSE